MRCNEKTSILQVQHSPYERNFILNYFSFAKFEMHHKLAF